MAVASAADVEEQASITVALGGDTHTRITDASCPDGFSAAPAMRDEEHSARAAAALLLGTEWRSEGGVTWASERLSRAAESSPDGARRRLLQSLLCTYPAIERTKLCCDVRGVGGEDPDCCLPRVEGCSLVG